MGKVKAGALIALFKQMARENWAYEWGKAQKGVVDCSGAFVYAMKTLGGVDIPHGSNAIVRQCAGAVQPIKSANPGYICTKWKAEFETDALERKYGDAELTPLDDSLETAAHDYMKRRLEK